MSFTRTITYRYAASARITHGEDGLSTILHDPEIDLVVVVLPVQGALEVRQLQAEALCLCLHKKLLLKQCRLVNLEHLTLLCRL